MKSAMTISLLLLMSNAALATVYSCPPNGARLDIIVDNTTGSAQSIRLSGHLTESSCEAGNLQLNYDKTLTCNPGVTTCATLSDLAPGSWLSQITAGAQLQNQQNLLIAVDPPQAVNALSWTVFRSVITVDNTGDGAASCPSLPSKYTCTLRGAIAAANQAPLPTLVQFDPAIFPAGVTTVISLTSTSSLQIGNDIMIDGTDTQGNPNGVGNPYAVPAIFNRVVQLPFSGSGFNFQGKSAILKGIFIIRPSQTTGAKPGDVVFFGSSSAANNTVSNVKIDGGGNSVTDKTSGQDCIGTASFAGDSSATANVVTSSELFYCLDKAVKSAYGSHVLVQNSWVHHSIGGGLQATLSGSLEADHNVVELSGHNALTIAYTSANGLSSHGSSTQTPAINSLLDANNNIVRYQTLRGLTADASAADLLANNNFSCGNLNGIGLLNGAGTYTSKITVRGDAFVSNLHEGAVIDNTANGNFGTDADATSAGNNAFAQNGIYNMENDHANLSIQAIGNQWFECPNNINCNPNVAGTVSYTPWQPYQGSVQQLPLSISGFYPTKARRGDMVHINGAGFNAIDSFSSTSECTANFNSCDNQMNPINGLCVYYTLPGASQTVPADIVAITPTDITFIIADTCSQSTTITVKRWDNSSAPPKIVSATGILCTNNQSFSYH